MKGDVLFNGWFSLMNVTMEKELRFDVCWEKAALYKSFATTK